MFKWGPSPPKLGRSLHNTVFPFLTFLDCSSANQGRRPPCSGNSSLSLGVRPNKRV